MTDHERLALLCHELRSPVAALCAIAEATPRVSDPVERLRLLELAVAGGRDIERLLSDPALVSLRREPVDVDRLLGGLGRPGVTVVVAGRPCVDGDPVRLRQVLSNLIANGLRHGSSVRVDAGETGTTVVIDVVDNGPGVDDGIDLFARGVSGAGSTGYGLWLAREIATAHGGTLELVRGDDEGARFRLALPSASVGR